MLRTITLLCTLCFTSVCSSQEPIEGLPQSHYHPDASDPAWLKYTARIHGHLGPMVTFGARMGTAALKAVDAKGYFDVEVTCEGPFVKPPESCYLDGVQVATGATMGKRNLQWIEKKEIVLRIKNTRSGKTAEVRPKENFLALLPGSKPADSAKSDNKQTARGDDDHAFDNLARKIAIMPEKDVLVITYPNNK